MLSKPTAFLFSVLCAGAAVLSSCEGQKPAAATAEKPATSAAAPQPAAKLPAVEARYECPMGCAGSQSNKPGKCPTCEMQLEKKS